MASNELENAQKHHPLNNPCEGSKAKFKPVLISDALNRVVFCHSQQICACINIMGSSAVEH